MPYEDDDGSLEDAIKSLIKAAMPYATRPVVADTLGIRTVWPNEWYL